MKHKKSQEELRILMELRRSNAASAVPNKKKYKRDRQSTRFLIDLNKERE
jgi:hypothetical protein